MTALHTRNALVALGIALCLASPLAAREQKTVFHGMPVEPDTGLKRDAKITPVNFERIWVFAGFTSPLAGDPVSTTPDVAATDRSGQVVRIDAGTGTAVWTVELGEAAAVGPAIDFGTIYQGTVSGTVVSIAVEDGTVHWRVAIGGAPLAPPVAMDGLIYVVTDAPELVVLAPRDGAIVSRAPLPGRPLPPVAGRGRVVVGTDRGIVTSFERATLAVDWQRDLRHPVTSPPTLAGKRIFVGTADRAVWSLRAGSGRTSWRQRTGSIVTVRPRALGGLLYIPCWDNDVYVLQEHNGHLLGRARLDHRLNTEVTSQPEHLFVAPFTEGIVVALALPYLGVAGRHELGVPGEWFSTAPVSAAGGITVGWGRDTGHLMALRVSPAPQSAKTPAADQPVPTGSTTGSGAPSATTLPEAPAAPPVPPEPPAVPPVAPEKPPEPAGEQPAPDVPPPV